MVTDCNYIDVTDDESDEEISSSEETLLERLAALKYMVPFKIRNRLFMFYHKWTGRLVYGFNKLGNGMWIMTTTIFLVGFPLFYEYQKEQHMIMLEKEQRLFPGSPDTMASDKNPTSEKRKETRKRGRKRRNIKSIFVILVSLI